MIKFRIIDDSFDTSSCQNYILSIQCSLNGFSFMIFDTISNKFIVHIEYEIVMASPYELKLELEKRLKSEAILNQTFKKVVVCFQNLRSVLVPCLHATGSDLKLLMDTVFEKNNDEQVLENDVIEGSSKLLFSVPGVLFRLFNEKYPNCSFIAPPLPSIRYSLATNKSTSKLYITRFHDLLILLLVYENKIHFLNQFYVRNDTDCIYYILNVARQLNLDQKSELLIMGRISQHSVLANSLRNYFEKVEFAPGDKRLMPSLTPPAGQEHYPILQIELTLCE